MVLGVGVLAALCRAAPQVDIVVPAMLHAAAWVLMIAAMMLPTRFPLIAIFRRITRDRPDAGRLVALVFVGFFAAWLTFGLLAHAADETLRWATGRDAWFVPNGWMLLLAAAMTAEKNLPWGRWLSTTLGVGLVAWAGAIVLVNA